MSSTTTFDTAQLEALTGAVSGSVLLPEHDGYDDARRVHNGMIDRRPALIVRCRSAADAAAAVRFARAAGADISVRGGGHNVGGLAVADGGSDGRPGRDEERDRRPRGQVSSPPKGA